MRTTGLAIAIALTAAAALLAMLALGGCGPGDEITPNGYSPEIAYQDGAPARDEHENPAPGTSDDPDANAAVLAQLDQKSLHPSHDPQAPCICATARYHNRWCARCNVGYVAGHRVENATLFEVLDPHGHNVAIERLKCDACQRAVSSDGFCDACRFGFVGRKAYFTRLTHGLAQGRSVDPANLSCPACQSHAAESGWCEACARGMVGNVAIMNRETFNRTAEEFQVLLAAIEKTQRCELCACAMVVHRTCPRCRISYAQGGSEPRSQGGPVRSQQQQ